VFANVSLHKNSAKKTRLSVETGNGYCGRCSNDELSMAYFSIRVRPIVAHVKLSLDDTNAPPFRPKHRDFITKFKTFNAPMNISVSHTKNSDPSRLSLMAENVLGPMDVSLGSRYTGTFDVRAKASTMQVLDSSGSDAGASSSSARSGTDEDNNDDSDDDDDDDGHGLHLVDVSPERTRGWIGDQRRPEEFDRRSLGRVELINSLSPIKLHLAKFQPSTAIRR